MSTSASRESTGTFDDVWVVVRCLNEAAVVGDVVRELREVFPHVVGVDDGSADDSSSVMREAGAHVVRHAVNLGAGPALQTGLAYALQDPRAAYFVCFDGDGQHRVADAVDMVQRMKTEALDVLVGSRFKGRTVNMPWPRALLLRMGNLVEKVTSRTRLSDSHNGLRVFSRRFALLVDLRLPGMAYASELADLIGRCGLPYDEHPVTITYTPYSLSKGQRNINSVNVALDVWLSRLLRGGRS